MQKLQLPSTLSSLTYRRTFCTSIIHAYPSHDANDAIAPVASTAPKSTRPPLRSQGDRAAAASNEARNLYERSLSRQSGSSQPLTQPRQRQTAPADLKERLRQRALERAGNSSGRTGQRQGQGLGKESRKGPDSSGKTRGGGKKSRGRRGQSAGEGSFRWEPDHSLLERQLGIKLPPGEELVKAHTTYTTRRLTELMLPYENSGDSAKTSNITTTHENSSSKELSSGTNDSESLQTLLLTQPGEITPSEYAPLTDLQAPPASSRPGRDANSGPTADYNDPTRQLSTVLGIAHAPAMEPAVSGEAMRESLFIGPIVERIESGRGGGVGIGAGVTGMAALKEVVVLAKRMGKGEWVDFVGKPELEADVRCLRAWLNIKNGNISQSDGKATELTRKTFKLEPVKTGEQIEAEMRRVVRGYLEGQHLNPEQLVQSLSTEENATSTATTATKAGAEASATKLAQPPSTLGLAKTMKSAKSMLEHICSGLVLNGSYTQRTSGQFIAEAQRVIAASGSRGLQFDASGLDAVDPVPEVRRAGEVIRRQTQERYMQPRQWFRLMKERGVVDVIVNRKNENRRRRKAEANIDGGGKGTEKKERGRVQKR